MRKADLDELQRLFWGRYQIKVTCATFLIYVAPVLCFQWFGAWWKIVALIPMGVGILWSPGFLRRFFAVVLYWWIVSDGSVSNAVDWTPCHDWLGIFWIWSALTCWQAEWQKARNSKAADAWRRTNG